MSTHGWQWGYAPGLCRFAHKAMGSLCEIFIARQDPKYAAQAAQAAFDELDQLENQLSPFIESSDVSRLNSAAAGQPLRVGLATWQCLRLAAEVHAATDGAFDVTIGSLLACWRPWLAGGPAPSDASRQAALEHTGMHRLELGEPGQVRVLSAGLRLDLGAIGKGFALDRMAEVLKDWSIDAALLQAGESSVLAVGGPPDDDAWHIPLRSDLLHARPPHMVRLRDHAISGSGFEAKGRHIIDPRTGLRAAADQAAWATAPSAALSDALSTAAMLMTPDQLRTCCETLPDTGICLARADATDPSTFGNFCTGT